MTTEQPTAPRLLRRRTDDRVVAGVASGLGDFLNVDPLLVRVAFVGLMVFGGLGLLLYVGGWLLVPEESSDESIVEEALRRSGITTTRWLLVMLFGLGAFIFLGGLGNAYPFSELAVGAGIALMVIVLGGTLMSRGPAGLANQPGAPATSPPPVSLPSADATVASPRTAAAPARRHRRRARPRSPLGWYVLGGVLVAIGLVALSTNVAGAEVHLAQYFGLALAVLGIGLVIGTWWGHARAMILLGMLLMPLAVAATFLTAPIEGGIGLHRFHPTNAEELQAEYRLLGGRMELDLTGMPAGGPPIEISASVAAGQLYVAVPSDASVAVEAAVGAGQLIVLGAEQGGTHLLDTVVRDGDGPRFVLDTELGIGSIFIDTEPAEGR